MWHDIFDYAVANKWQIGFMAYVVFSIMVTPIPDDLRHFDWRTWIPAVLKGLSGTLATKFPKVTQPTEEKKQ